MGNNYASTDTSVLSFISSQNTGPDGRGGTAQFAPALLNNGIAGSTTNNVIGFAALSASGSSPISLGSGFNTVVIDGYNSPSTAASGAADNFSFTVDATGLVTLTDTTTGKTQQVSGVSNLIFNGAAAGTDANGNPDYQQMFFIGNASQTQVTELYNAAFGRQPDLGGVEYYAHQLNSGYSFQQIATEFMASPEFQARYGANVSDAQFVTNLYQNVLHRAASATELTYYTSALANYEAGSVVNTVNPALWTRGQELLNFTNSPENQADVAPFVINTASTPTNGLVYSTPTSGSESVTTVLTQGETSGVIDTNLINPSSLQGNTTVGNVSITAPGALTPAEGVSAAQTTGTYTLSPTVPDFISNQNSATFTVNGSAAGGSFINTPAGTVNLHSTGNVIYQESYGVQPFSVTPVITATGFGAGDSLINPTIGDPSYGRASGTYILLTPTAASPIQGASLSHFGFGTTISNEYIVNVGTVGSGTAAEVAAAANKVYVPSDAAGEQIVFFGQITSGANSGGTAIFDWVDVTGAPSSADSNGNHQVDANEFAGGVILVGVSASSISTATFYHK